MAFQIRSMRDRESWSQEELAERVGMNQNAISRLENPSYGKATITTLKRLARVFDVALMIQFVPFSRLTYWVSGTEFPDKGLRDSYYSIPSFTNEDEISLGRGAEAYQGKSVAAGGLLCVGEVPEGHPGLGRAETELSRAAGQ
jgi:transcriptional regulator with XRE-family HTH domain